ncbi:RepB family plasmid replication initiator protein, partial [Conchiformibius steedae]|uniref:RepB family plasmid replication initiator protein n=1 Tax=Conchiformibius steedae TaxID=153493 RepID=UPI0026EB7298
MAKNLVVKDNSLINASYNLDLIEQRLILLAIIQARKSKIPLTKRDKIVVTASEYADEFKVSQSGSLYQNLKNACDVLFERQFSYKETLENGEVKFSKSRWVSKVSYI